MVELWVDMDNEFYLLWSDKHSCWELTNLISGSHRLVVDDEELADLRGMCRRYNISEENVEMVLDGARRAHSKPPEYYDQIV